MTKGPKPQLALLAGAASLITVALMLVIKIAAYARSDADSVLASLIDSACDASVSLMSFMAIRISLKPADSEHRYGHGKVEGLAALLQAAFIGGAGVFLLFSTGASLLHPHPVEPSLVAVYAMGASTVLALLLIAVQRFTLRQAPSLAVEADKEHYAGDVAINLGVMAVMLALRFGAPGWLDPLFSLVVAFWLFFVMWRVAEKGADMVLDRELPDELREAITLRTLNCPDVLGLHDLRTYKSGMRQFISFDIEVDQSLSLPAAHDITRAVERALLDDFPLAEIMIHIDPYGDRDDARHHVAGVHH